MPPKRKRTKEPSLQSKLDTLQEEVARALKTAKGFERQRLSKRSHEADVSPEKQQRLEREIAVLKSLDLHQTARAHLYSSLLKIKSIAASTDLPDELRTGVPKPELSEEEKVSLHNVTSGLYNREQVKQVIDKAVKTICQALNVPVPEKGKRSRKEKRKEAAQSSKKDESSIMLQRQADDAADEEEEEEEEVTDFEGFESDVDEPGTATAASEATADPTMEEDFSQYDHLLGSASDDDNESGDGSWDEDLLAKYRGTETPNLDDISVSGSESDAESLASDQQESSASPEPQPTKKQKTERAPKAAPKDSTFLPSLMGGYVSGSESASDIDVAPPKKRRGQRARQAIWEKKYGSGAKHLQKEALERKYGRDNGWDMRRGAVGESSNASRRTPWKQGVNNPFSKDNSNQRNSHVDKGQRRPQRQEERPRRPTKKDDEGPLHPSWAARKQAKDAQKGASFAGSKITFD